MILIELPKKEEIACVKTKDLVIGGLYYGGQDPWRNTWCYLGRTTDGEYLWCFIGNNEWFKEKPNEYLQHPDGDEICTTKNNKKVRLLQEFCDEISSEGFVFALDNKTKSFLNRLYNATLPIKSIENDLIDNDLQIELD